MGKKEMKVHNKKNIVNKKTGGKREDKDGKPAYHLIPPMALKDVAIWLEKGAKRYGPRNWEKGLDYDDTYRAAIGHLTEWYLRNDDELHLAAAICNILFLMEYDYRGRDDIDNRPLKYD